MERHARNFAGAHEHVVLPLRSQPQGLSAHLIEPLGNPSDPEVSISVRARRVRRLAIRGLPKNVRKGHGSTLSIEHNSIQDAFRGSGVAKQRQE